MLWLVAATFVVTIFIGIPVSFALGFTAIIGFLTSGLPMTKMVIRTLTSIDTFPLLAGPFFILAGEIISRGNIMNHIIRFAESLVGHIRGGLAYTNVLDSMFFAGISGSAVADVAAMGKIEIDMMVEGGYEKDFSVALTIASSCCGPIIPPSVIMVIYALASSVSVGALFTAGILPGILMGFSMMAVCYYFARKRNYKAVTESFSLRQVFIVGKKVFWYLLLPFIVMGGIIGGVFTATEAGCVGAVYSLILVVSTRVINFRTLFKCFVRAGIVTSVVIIIISMASALSWYLAVEQVPQMMLVVLEPLVDSPSVFLFVLNIMFLLIGTVLEPGAAIMILVPVLLPTFMKMGISELHMGMIMVFNLTIGLITPPVGICIYVGSAIGELSVQKTVRASIPFIIALIVVLFLITYIPEISLLLPRLFGFI
jgi:tripartite ATP-independent transporter DctM subunit